MRRHVLVFLLALGVAAGATAAAAAPQPAPARKPVLQRALDQVVAAGAPGAIALVRDGDRTVRLTSGYGNLRPRAPMRPGDRFRVGSITKTFVATVALQLVGEGTLALDDSVERWLPGTVPNGRKIKLRHLLNMSSGLFDFLDDGDTTVLEPYQKGNFTYAWTPRRLLQIAVSHRPHFAPGAGWHYCNTCYVALGLVVEAATGNSIASELRRRIFTPLRLHSTTFATKPRIAGAHAHGYELVGKPPLVDVSVFSPSFAWAAGAVVSSADDLARFFRALLGGRLLPPKLLQAMETTVAAEVGRYGPGRYGLGLFALRLPCVTVWGNGGDTAGYFTLAFNSRDGKRAVVLLANAGGETLSSPAHRALQGFLATAYCG